MNSLTLIISGLILQYTALFIWSTAFHSPTHFLTTSREWPCWKKQTGLLQWVFLCSVADTWTKGARELTFNPTFNGCFTTLSFTNRTHIFNIWGQSTAEHRIQSNTRTKISTLCEEGHPLIARLFGSNVCPLNPRCTWWYLSAIHVWVCWGEWEAHGPNIPVFIHFHLISDAYTISFIV